MIFINPSHGGYDIGGGSCVFFKEKDLVLKISKYQKNRFDELGIDNMLIRNDDYFLSLNDRLTLINNSLTNNDLLISNHLNYGGDQGIEIVYSLKTSYPLINHICDSLKYDHFIIRNVYQKLDRTGNDFYDLLKYPLCKEKFLIYYGFVDNELDLNNLLYEWPNMAESTVKGICEYLNIPYSLPSKKIYIAKKIESLDDIALNYKISKEIVKKENHLNTDIIYPNFELSLPIDEIN